MCWSAYRIDFPFGITLEIWKLPVCLTGRVQFKNLMVKLISEEFKMNKDQVKGAAKNIGGKIQENAGKLVGNKEQQVKGLANQAEGKVQQKIGNLKKAVKDAGKP